MLVPLAPRRKPWLLVDNPLSFVGILLKPLEDGFFAIPKQLEKFSAAEINKFNLPNRAGLGGIFRARFLTIPCSSVVRIAVVVTA